jgi:hypothetical protein
MRLDRNKRTYGPITGPGKYALIKIRKLDEYHSPDTANYAMLPQIVLALELLEATGILDWCDKPETESFVIRLKDAYAQDALATYAMKAEVDDPEYGLDVMKLAKRSGQNHPNCKRPD